MEAYGTRTVTMYEETRVLKASSSSVGYSTNPVDDGDPAGTIYLFGMGVCFASSSKLFSTNRKVLPTDIGYDYYRRLAHGGIKNVSYVLYKDGRGDIVKACDCDELEDVYDPSAYDALQEEAYEDDDWDREFALNTWRDRELKRCGVEWKMSAVDEAAAVEMIKRVVVEEEGKERRQPAVEEKREKEGGKTVVYNVTNNITNNVSNVRVERMDDDGKEKDAKYYISEGRVVPHVVLVVVIFILLAALGFSVFSVVA